MHTEHYRPTAFHPECSMAIALSNTRPVYRLTPTPALSYSRLLPCTVFLTHVCSRLGSRKSWCIALHDSRFASTSVRNVAFCSRARSTTQPSTIRTHTGTQSWRHRGDASLGAQPSPRRRPDFHVSQSWAVHRFRDPWFRAASRLRCRHPRSTPAEGSDQPGPAGTHRPIPPPD